MINVCGVLAKQSVLQFLLITAQDCTIYLISGQYDSKDSV